MQLPSSRTPASNIYSLVAPYFRWSLQIGSSSLHKTIPSRPSSRYVASPESSSTSPIRSPWNQLSLYLYTPAVPKGPKQLFLHSLWLRFEMTEKSLWRQNGLCTGRRHLCGGIGGEWHTRRLVCIPRRISSQEYPRLAAASDLQWRSTQRADVSPFRTIGHSRRITKE